VVRRLLLCAAEASGDALGAALVDELSSRGGWEIEAVAGPKLRERAVSQVARAEDAQALGISEVVRRIPGMWRVLSRVDEALDRRPDAVVGIDAPGLMSRIGRHSRARGVRFVQWVAPQVWAWRPGRARTIASWADEVLCLFPWEPAWFRPHGVAATFVGHPGARLTDRTRPRADAPTILLAPGSRPSEIARLWPVMREVAALLRGVWPRCRLLVAVAPTVDAASLGGLAVERLDGLAGAAELADLALCSSGTATLELAAAGVPQVVVYATSAVTFAVGKRLVRGVEHLALPNILAGGAVVPEHVQRLEPRAIAADLRRLWDGGGDEQREALRVPLLGLQAERAVAAVADALENVR
jgi:lipid-A-disaccharide synthase